jgi:hypothetical protein
VEHDPERDAETVPEALLADFVAARVRGTRPSAAQFAARLGNEQARARFLRLVHEVNRIAGLVPVRAQPDVVVGERYRLLRELGAGGFGRVWLAADERLENKHVAVKLLHGLGASRDVRKQLENEKRALARAEHPGIVRVLDVGEHEGSPFLVMDVIAGITLADLLFALRPGGVPPQSAPTPDAIAALGAFARGSGELALESRGWWRLVACVLRRLLDALHAAHSVSVIHCDLKPSNVMLRDNGEVVLLDFGVARTVDQDAVASRSGFTGTLPYMAPEQATGTGKGFEVQTDVYQAGRVLYELLAFRPAVDPMQEMAALVEAAKKNDFAAPRACHQAVPRALDYICMRALESDPRKRYATAKEFREDLEDFLAGMPPRHVRTTAFARWSRGVRRRMAKHRGVLLAATLLVAGAGAGVALWAGSGAGLRVLGQVEHSGRRFATEMLVERPGEVFGVLVEMTALGVEGARVPLLALDGSLSVPAVKGTRRIEMELPRRARVADAGRFDVRFRVYEGAQAEQVRNYHQQLLAWIDDARNQGAPGVPADTARAVAEAVLAGTRGTGAEGSLGLADLLGAGWVAAPVTSP